MSTTYHFICHEAKLCLWVGQSSGDGPLRIYNTEDHHEAMKYFLERIEGKPFVFVSEHSKDADTAATEEYEEVDPDQMARIRAEVRGEK